MKEITILVNILIAGLAATGIPAVTQAASLFTSVGDDAAGGGAPPGVIAAYAVTVDHLPLQLGPQILTVELPGVGLVVGHFQTVMGRALGNSARDFYFATPRIIHPLHGVPVGVVAMNDVVLTIEQLSTTMEGFRGSKNPVVFSDDFDSGTLAVWSAIFSGL